MLQPQVVPTRDVVYVGGGLGNTCMLSVCVFAYNIAMDTWKTLPESRVALFGMCLFQNSLLTIGGVCEEGMTGKVYCLNEAKETWEEFLPAMPTNRFSLSVFSTNSVLVACGGGTWGDGADMPVPCSTVEVYRHKSNSWSSAENLPQPSATMSNTFIGNTCFLLRDTKSGDRCGPMYADITEITNSKADEISNSTHENSALGLVWHCLPPPPVANTSIVATSSYLLAVGGHNDKGTVTAAHLYIKESKKWWQLASGELPQGLEGCGLAVLDTTGEVMVVGGEDAAGMFTDSVFIGNLL